MAIFRQTAVASGVTQNVTPCILIDNHFLVLQSSRRGRESWLLYLNCVHVSLPLGAEGRSAVCDCGTVKHVLSSHSKKDKTMVLKTNFCALRAFCTTLTCIKRKLVFKNNFCLLFEWPLNTAFTVLPDHIHLFKAALVRIKSREVALCNVHSLSCWSQTCRFCHVRLPVPNCIAFLLTLTCSIVS